MNGRGCKDCGAGARPRPAPYPGPRCATHHRARRQVLREHAAERRRASVYGLPAGAYSAILTAQNGVCAGCGPRTGRNGSGKRRLAVDHDHRTGEVRGLLCSTCNQVVGDFRDDPLTLLRLANYLINPPARLVLGMPSSSDTVFDDKGGDT